MSHDLYANVFRKGATEREELRVSKITVLVLGVIAIVLGVLFENQNIAFMVGLAFAIAASCNFPIILLSMYWSKLTTRGAMLGGWLGLLTAVVLMILGPTIWVQILGHEKAIFPYEYPALFSISVAFLGIWFFSATDNSEEGNREREQFRAQFIRSQTGYGVEQGRCALTSLLLRFRAGGIYLSSEHQPRHQRCHQHHYHAGKHHHQAGNDTLLLTEFIRACRARTVRCCTKSCAFRHPFTNGKP